MSIRNVLLPCVLAACLALPACKQGAPPVPAAAPPAALPPAAGASKAPATATPSPVAASSVTQPALRVTTVDGAVFDLAAQGGKWTVVNFWATWCGPCLKEMPELSALDAMREHIVVVGLAYEDTTIDDMRAFLKTRPVVYPVALIDVYEPPSDFETPRGLPMTYLIAPDGTVAKKYTGPVTAAQIEADIAAAGGPKVG